MSERTLADRLRENPDAVLTRSELAALGYPRRAVDAIFKACAREGGVESWPGYSKPLIRVADFLRVRQAQTFQDRPGKQVTNRVRPIG